MRKQVIGLLLIASLALAAYGSGAAARGLVRSISNQLQANIPQSSNSVVETALSLELAEAEPGNLNPGSFTVSTWKLVGQSNEALIIDQLGVQESYQDCPGKLDQTELGPERTNSHHFFIAGVLADGETKVIN